MKKLALLTAVTTLVLPGILSADNGVKNNNVMKKSPTAEVETQGSMCNPTNWTFQARGAAFIPLKQNLRKMFGSGEPTMELEGSYAIYKDKWTTCDQFLFWMNTGWTRVLDGKTRGWGYPTKMNLVPFTAGFSYQWNIVRNVDFYLGIGASYSLLWAKIKNPFQERHFRRGQFGFTTKTGFRFTFATNFFFDIFGDYYFTSFRKMNSSLGNIENNFSGFFVGGGFGGKW